jgi:hypothetical protein
LRYVAFDFETTVWHQPNPDVERFEHEVSLRKKVPNSSSYFQVNYAVAMVFCTDCLGKGRDVWDNQDHKSCKVCGPARTKVFSPVDGDPLDGFMTWLLKDLNPKYKTIAFSHYGGRFDMHFCKNYL